MNKYDKEIALNAIEILNSDDHIFHFLLNNDLKTTKGRLLAHYKLMDKIAEAANIDWSDHKENIEAIFEDIQESGGYDEYI